MTTEPKLLPCPFCGEAPKVKESEAGQMLLFQCKPSCFFADLLGFNAITDDGLMAWNRRALTETEAS